MDCVTRYGISLTHPFAELPGEICAPNMYATRSTKLTTRAMVPVGVLTNASTGLTYANVQFNPWQMLAQSGNPDDGYVVSADNNRGWCNFPLISTRDSFGPGTISYNALYAISSGLKGDIGSSGAYVNDNVQPTNCSFSNSPYTIGQALGSFNAGRNPQSAWEFRVVSAGLRVRYTGQLSTTAGSFYYYRDPNNDQIGANYTGPGDGYGISTGSAAVSPDGGVASVSSTGIEICWKPSRDSDYSFQSCAQDYYTTVPAWSNIPANAWNAYDARPIGVMMTGFPTGGSFIAEAICHMEIRTPQLVGTVTVPSADAAAAVTSSLSERPSISPSQASSALMDGLSNQGSLGYQIGSSIGRALGPTILGTAGAVVGVIGAQMKEERRPLVPFFGPGHRMDEL